MSMRAVSTLLVLAILVVPAARAAQQASPPVITGIPPDSTIEAQNPSGAYVTWNATAFDYRGRSVPVTCNPASGALFPFGATDVTCVARDSEGRTTTKRFKITVVDTTPPAITVPQPIRTTTASRRGKVVSYTASATDVVDGPVPVSCSPASATLFPVGTVTVTCSAQDARHNASSATFTVSVGYSQRQARSAPLLSPAVGARVTSAPTLRWRTAPRARFYNVQLFRRGHKILSVWPTRTRFRLHARWTFHGKRYRLRGGTYTWLVWPAYGSTSRPRYGKMLGISSFVFARR